MFSILLILHLMSNPTWGELAKSLTDDETIEEAISRLILVHEQDEASHLGAGESLQSHKSDEMIDHPAGSVAVDKFANARVIISAFESLDGWNQYVTGSGLIQNQLGSLQLYTGVTNNSFCLIDVVPDSFTGFDVSKAFFWRSTIKFSHSTGFTSYFGAGYMSDEVDFNGFGFRVLAGALVAWMGDYTNFATISIPDVDLTVAHTYEIRYTASPQVAKFYIDNVLVATFDSGNWPSNADEFVNYMIRNTTAFERVVGVTEFMYQQEL